MADELSITVSAAFVKGDTNQSFAKTGLTFDVSGTDYVKKTQTIGTSEEALDIGDITTPGYILAYNTDSTNYVEIRANTGEADVVKIRAGGVALFELASSTPYAIADTASCALEYLLIEA